MPSAREVIEHIERAITTSRSELEATVTRLDALVTLREMFYAADTDPDGTADAAIAAMTPDEESRARYASTTARAFPEPKEHR